MYSATADAAKWSSLLQFIDGLNRRVKEPGWLPDDRQTVYLLKDRMLELLLRKRPACVSLTLYYSPYILYSNATKDRAGALMRMDRNQFGFEYYLAQVEPSAQDIDCPEKASVELQAVCTEQTFSFHMPVSLALKCGIDPASLPRKPWISAPDFHHNMLSEMTPAIEALLHELSQS